MAATCGSLHCSVPDLASIRRAKGISLEQISSATKIGLRYLQAIERLEFKYLPGGLFSTSYIRQYAHAIDYDEWELLACFETAMHPQQELPEPPPPPSPLAALWRLIAPARR